MPDLALFGASEHSFHHVREHNFLFSITRRPTPFDIPATYVRSTYLDECHHKKNKIKYHQHPGSTKHLNETRSNRFWGSALLGMPSSISISLLCYTPSTPQTHHKHTFPALHSGIWIRHHVRQKKTKKIPGTPPARQCLPYPLPLPLD